MKVSNDFELPTPHEMRACDRAAVAEGTSFETLMERAGCAVAEVVAKHAPAGAPILVLAGPGNNGGDAFVAAHKLLDDGHAVAVLDLSGDRPHGAAAAAMGLRLPAHLEARMAALARQPFLRGNTFVFFRSNARCIGTATARPGSLIPAECSAVS